MRVAQRNPTFMDDLAVLLSCDNPLNLGQRLAEAPNVVDLDMLREVESYRRSLVFEHNQHTGRQENTGQLPPTWESSWNFDCRPVATLCTVNARSNERLCANNEGNNK